MTEINSIKEIIKKFGNKESFKENYDLNFIKREMIHKDLSLMNIK